MTHKELEELGLSTVAKDNNSFVSKTKERDVWLEIFHCMETGFLQIMRATVGDKGEVLRHSMYEGKTGGIKVIKQFLK